MRRRETHLWLSAGAHVVHYPLRDASIINAVVIVEDGLSRAWDRGPETLDGAALLEEAGLVAGDADLRALIAAGDSWRRWPLDGRPALAHWSQGAVTLLGDAAHPCGPLAQGAAMAIEDAEALARAFPPGVAPAEAFRAYERARVARATKVQRASRRQGDHYHASGLTAAARDLVISVLDGQRMRPQRLAVSLAPR